MNSLQGALNSATKNGVEYNKLITIDGWELKLAPPRQRGDPIKIIFNEIEIDDYLPSIKFKIDINIQQFTHLLAYSGEIWIECSVWDRFSKGLNEGKNTILNDMDDTFIIKIIKSNEFI